MRALCSIGNQINGLSYLVESEYDIKIKEMKETVKDRYVIDTEKERLLFEEAGDKEACLIFISGIYEYVKEKGFNHIAEIHPTTCGKNYIRTGGKLYTLSSFTESMGKEFSIEKNSREVTKLLAAFHRAAEGYTPPPGGKCKSDWGRWIEKYRKQCRALKKYSILIKDKEDKTEFERMFLKENDCFIKRMEQSIDILKKKGYIDIVEESMKKRQVCLSSFKKYSFYKEKSYINIKSLDKCRYDIIEKDIAELLQKLLEIKSKKYLKDIAELIKTYHSENPLSDNSIEIIKAFILFPEEYEKICSRYCKGKDKWTEKVYIERLKSAMDYENRKIWLIDAIERIKLA